MPLEGSSVPDVRPARRRWLPLAIVVIVVLVALAAFAMRRNASSAAKPEDCETKPPPNTFAVAECDDGRGAAASKPGAPAAHAPAAKP
jgi:hypothetical protein